MNSSIKVMLSTPSVKVELSSARSFKVKLAVQALKLVSSSIKVMLATPSFKVKLAAASVKVKLKVLPSY